jgi:hypothetical protein
VRSLLLRLEHSSSPFFFSWTPLLPISTSSSSWYDFLWHPIACRLFSRTRDELDSTWTQMVDSSGWQVVLGIGKRDAGASVQYFMVPTCKLRNSPGGRDRE